MSKLKCWKKVSDEYWKKEDGTDLMLDELDNRWDVVLFTPGDVDADMPFSSTSKKESFSFAQKYMKEHDSCSRRDIVDPHIARNKETLELIRKRRRAEESFSKEFIK